MINTPPLEDQDRMHALRGLNSPRVLGIVVAFLSLWAVRHPALDLFSFVKDFAGALAASPAGAALLPGPRRGLLLPRLRLAMPRPEPLDLNRPSFAALEARVAVLVELSRRCITQTVQALGQLEVQGAGIAWVEGLGLLIEATAFLELKRQGEAGEDAWVQARREGRVAQFLEEEAQRVGRALLEVWAELAAGDEGSLAVAHALPPPPRSPHEVVADFFALDLTAPGARQAFETAMLACHRPGSAGEALMG